MTMNAERLELLVRVADSQTDHAARDLARHQARLAEQQARLEELRGYLHEYRTRPLPANPTLMSNRERFLARLGEAEAQQVRAVGQAEEAVTRATLLWKERRQSGEKFEQLQAGAEARATRVLLQREQRGMDELAMGRFLAQRTGSPE